MDIPWLLTAFTAATGLKRGMAYTPARRTTGISTQAIRYPDGPIRAELDSFEYEYTRTGVRYSTMEGLHDDCVMALALAYRAKSGHREVEYAGNMKRNF